MLIRVKVLAEAKENEVIEIEEGRFEVKVKTKAVRGEADKAVINLLDDYFQISPVKVKLIKVYYLTNSVTKWLE